MTDHADTIRRFFAMCQPVQYHAGAWGPPTEALDALLAELQQAIDDKEGLSAICSKWEAEYVALQARCEQAIDALGRAMYFLDPNQGEPRDPVSAYIWLRTALPEGHPNRLSAEEAVTLADDPLSLGEQR